MDITAINKELFDQNLRTCFDAARSQIEDSPAEQLIPQMLVAIGGEREDSAWDLEMVMMPDFGENRYSLLQGLGYKYGQEGKPVVAAFLMTEVWASVMTQAEYEGHIENRLPPVDDPDHKEWLIAFGMTLDLHAAAIRSCINRNEEGHAVLGEPEKVESGVVIKNNLLNAFFLEFCDIFS